MERHLRLTASVAAFLLIASAGPASAEIYRWTDESGHTHFTSDPSQVPARYRDQSAEPGESKSTFNSSDSSDGGETPSADDAPSQPTPATTSRPPTSGYKPVPRINTRRSGSSQPRMAEFEAEEKAEAAASEKASGPKKYFRDCSDVDPTRRCKGTLNPEWVQWNEQRKLQEKIDSGEVDPEDLKREAAEKAAERSLDE